MSTDLRQSDGWEKYLKSIGWEVENLKVGSSKTLAKAYVRRIPLIGSVIKIQRPPSIPSAREIDHLAKKYHALLVKVEPQGAPRKPLTGFGTDSSPNLPTKTITIDLTKSEKELWENLSQDARQSVRKAHSKKLSVVSYWNRSKRFKEELEKFHQLFKETGQRQGFWIPSVKQLEAKANAFGKDVLLFLSYQSSGLPPLQPKHPCSGAFVLTAEDTAFYHHAASSPEGQELHAPYLLLWEILRKLKALGIKTLDLEGIFDPRFSNLTRRWKGFTTFKQKFGGEEKEYPTPLVKYYNPLLNILFKFFS